MQAETSIEHAVTAESKPSPRGIFEKVKGTGMFWIRYTDTRGRKRREKSGTLSMAKKLLAKRKTEVLQGKKLPELNRRKAVLFRDLVEDAVTYAREHHQSNRERDYRADLLIELFGNQPADTITPQQVDRELSRVAREREWAPA